MPCWSWCEVGLLLLLSKESPNKHLLLTIQSVANRFKVIADYTPIKISKYTQKINNLQEELACWSGCEVVFLLLKESPKQKCHQGILTMSMVHIWLMYMYNLLCLRDDLACWSWHEVGVLLVFLQSINPEAI